MDFIPAFLTVFSKLSSFIIALFKVKNLRRKLVCLVLVLSLLILPLPSQAFTELSSLSSSVFYSYTTPLKAITALSKWLFTAKPPQARADTLADRLANVATLRVTPFKQVVYQNQSLTFSALPLDSLDRVAQGVKLTWESSDLDKVQIDEAGRATFLQPGSAQITCRAGNATGSATVLIRPGNRPEQSDAQWRADQATLNRIPTTTSSTTTSGASSLGKLIPYLMCDSFE